VIEVAAEGVGMRDASSVTYGRSARGESRGSCNGLLAFNAPDRRSVAQIGGI
jgi:hypothetical protein